MGPYQRLTAFLSRSKGPITSFFVSKFGKTTKIFKTKFLQNRHCKTGISIEIKVVKWTKKLFHFDQRGEALMNEDQSLIKSIKNHILKPYKYPMENQGLKGWNIREKEGRKKLIKELLSVKAQEFSQLWENSNKLEKEGTKVQQSLFDLGSYKTFIQPSRWCPWDTHI